MSKLPVVSGKDRIKVLEKFGYVVFRQKGSHGTIIRDYPPSQTTIPLHRGLDRGDVARYLAPNWNRCGRFYLEIIINERYQNIT